MAREFDVIIVGAGPAGIFAALELARVERLRVLLLEKGPDIEERIESVRPRGGERPSYRKDSKALLCGWGGAGGLSDGKLTMSPEVGGQLASFLPVGEVEALLQEVDQVYLRFGAPQQLYGVDEDARGAIARRGGRAPPPLLPPPPPPPST